MAKDELTNVSSALTQTIHTKSGKQIAAGLLRRNKTADMKPVDNQRRVKRRQIAASLDRIRRELDKLKHIMLEDVWND